MKVRESLAARVSQAIASEGGGEAPAPETPAAAPDAGAPAAPALAGLPGGASKLAQEAAQEAVQGDDASAPAPTPAPEADPQRAILEAKLEAAREANAARKARQEAEAAKKQADDDRAAAAAERTKWEHLREGTFKEGIAALGKDPRAVFEEMQREAIEASTPEFQIKQMRAEFEKQMGEKLKPLQDTVEELRRQRDELAAKEQQRELQTHFGQALEAPDFRELRIAYDDDVLFGFVNDFAADTETFFKLADQYKIPLTDPSQGFTMREGLQVLKAIQDEDTLKRQQRAARFAPPAAPSASATPTVNGTAERRNAGEAISPDLAGERAAPPRELSRKERIALEIRKAQGG
jgi:hypothetical protein